MCVREREKEEEAAGEADDGRRVAASIAAKKRLNGREARDWSKLLSRLRFCHLVF